MIHFCVCPIKLPTKFDIKVLSIPIYRLILVHCHYLLDCTMLRVHGPIMCGASMILMDFHMQNWTVPSKN